MKRVTVIVFSLILFFAATSFASAYTESIPNPGLESGAVDWYIVGNNTPASHTGVMEASSNASAARTGSWTAHTNITAWTAGYYYFNPMSGNAMPVTPGAAYNITYYVRGWSAVAKSGVTIYPYWANGTIQPAGNYSYAMYSGLPSNSSYAANTIVYTPSPYTSYIKLQFNLSNGVGEFWFDDFTMHPASDDTQLQFAVSSATVNETDGNVTVTVNRVGSQPPSAVNVNYTTVNGSALAGVNYNSTGGTLAFAASDTSKSFTVDVLHDTNYTGDTYFTVQLTAPAGLNNYTLGSPTTLTVDVLEADPVPSGASPVIPLSSGIDLIAAAVFTVIALGLTIAGFVLYANKWRAGIVFSFIAAFVAFLLGVFFDAGIIFAYVDNAATVMRPPYIDIVYWTIGCISMLVCILYAMDLVVDRKTLKAAEFQRMLDHAADNRMDDYDASGRRLT